MLKKFKNKLFLLKFVKVIVSIQCLLTNKKNNI